MWPFDILRKKERQIRRKYKLIIVWCSVGVILITGTIVLPLVLIKKNIYLMIESTSYHVYSQISQSIETVTLCAKTNKGVIIDDAIFNCDDLLSGISLANNQDGSASISGNSNVSGEFTSTINCTSIKISKTDSINIQFSITAIITTKYSLGDTPGEGYSLFSSLPDQNLRGWTIHFKTDVTPTDLTGQSDAGWFISIISGSNGRHLVYRFNSVTLNTCIVASNGMSDETSYAYSTSGGWSSNGSSGGVTWLSWFFDFSSYTCTGTFDEDFAFIASYYRSSSVSWSQGIINCWLEEPTSTF